MGLCAAPALPCLRKILSVLRFATLLQTRSVPQQVPSVTDYMDAHKYLKRGCKEARARLFSVVPSSRTKGSGHTEIQDFPLNIRKHFSSVRVSEHWHRLPWRGGGVSFCGDIRKTSSHGPGQLALCGPAWAGVLDQVIPSNFNLSVILQLPSFQC